MTVSNNDILRATATFTLGRGSLMQQVIHYQYTGAGDTDDEVGDKIKLDFDAIYANVETKLDTNVTSEELDVWLWDAALNQFDGIYTEDFTSINGTEVGEMLPNGAAAMIGTYTSLPRRTGRKFVSGFAESGYGETGWTAGVATQLGLMVADIFSSQSTANGTLQAGVFNEATESFLAFKNAGYYNVYANYQRRRRPGVGI